MSALNPPRLSLRLSWAVVGTCIGLFAVGAISSLVLRLPTQTMITDAGLLRTLLLEALLAAAWIPVLRRRGWSLGCVSVRLEVMDLARGVGVLVLSYLAYWLAFTLAMLAFPMFPDFARGMQFGGAPSWWAVVIVSLVNPVAEEFLYLGFITNLVRADGLQVALLAGIVARAAVHVYQGPVGLVSAIAIGLVFGIYYLRSDRLWPVVVAHGLSDFIALGRLANSAA